MTGFPQEKRLTKVGLFCSERRWLRGGMIEVFKLAQGYYQIKLYWRLLGSPHSRAERRASQQPQKEWFGLTQDSNGWRKQSWDAAQHAAEAVVGWKAVCCLHMTSPLAPSFVMNFGLASLLHSGSALACASLPAVPTGPPAQPSVFLFHSCATLDSLPCSLCQSHDSSLYPSQ